MHLACFGRNDVRWVKQSGRTPWRAASLSAERKALWRESDTVPEAGIITTKTNPITKISDITI